MRLLILPALFDEANRLRHFTLAVMRGLHAEGVDSFLPDFPGWNESLAPLDQQTLAVWLRCADRAACHFAATHVLALRGSAMLAPAHLPGWHYGPLPLASVLNQMLRAQVISSQERGHKDTRASLIEQGLTGNLTVCGYRLNPAMVQGLVEASSVSPSHQTPIPHDVVGRALWRAAEAPDGEREAQSLVRYITATANHPAPCAA